jgi:hypothetical protein
VTVDNGLVIDAGVTFDVSGSENYSVSIEGALENNGTFSAQEGTVTFNGSDNQVFIPGSSSYYNITLNNSGGDEKTIVIRPFLGDLNIDNDLTLTDGTLDLDTNDPAISIGGDLAISDGAVWTKGSGIVTFDGATQFLSDANTVSNNLGDALIDCDILTVATNATVTSIQISSGSITIISPSVPFTVNGVLTITGELEMADGSVVDAGGDVTVAAAGTLDMDGTSRLKMEEDLSFSGLLEASDDSRIDLDGDTQQTIYGSATPIFNSLFCSSNASILNLTATINDTLDAGGEDFTISNGKTLTMETGSVTILSGGTWALDGTLALQSDSKVLYTTSNQSTMDGLTYSNVEHDGGTLSQGGAFTVDIFTNTSGNFVASEDITASGIVWTAGQVTRTPSQAWDIGTDGITIDGGVFVATTGTFAVAAKLPEVFVKVPITLNAPSWLRVPPLCSIWPYTSGVMVLLAPVLYKTLEAASRVNVPFRVQVPPDISTTLPASIVSVLPAEIVKFCPPVTSESSIATVRLSIVAPPLQIRLSILPIPVIVPETVCVPPPSK